MMLPMMHVFPWSCAQAQTYSHVTLVGAELSVYEVPVALLLAHCPALPSSRHDNTPSPDTMKKLLQEAAFCNCVSQYIIAIVSSTS
jgi:hypothetical protein